MNKKLSLPEASKMASISPSTLRRWIQAGELKGKKNTTGEWEIEHENLMATLAKQAPKTTLHGGSMEAPRRSQIEIMEQSIIVATTTLERERKINDELRLQNKELIAENRALHIEIKAILSGNYENILSRWVRTSTEAPPRLHDGHHEDDYNNKALKIKNFDNTTKAPRITPNGASTTTNNGGHHGASTLVTLEASKITKNAPITSTKKTLKEEWLSINDMALKLNIDKTLIRSWQKRDYIRQKKGETSDSAILVNMEDVEKYYKNYKTRKEKDSVIPKKIS